MKAWTVLYDDCQFIVFAPTRSTALMQVVCECASQFDFEDALLDPDTRVLRAPELDARAAESGLGILWDDEEHLKLGGWTECPRCQREIEADPIIPTGEYDELRAPAFSVHGSHPICRECLRFTDAGKRIHLYTRVFDRRIREREAIS